MKRAKIVCTVGPACVEYDVLKRMAQAGMDVARLNFSHGDHSSHGLHLENVRRLERELKRPFGTMIDTKGPEIRTKGLKSHSPVLLERGRELILTADDFEAGDSTRVGVTHAPLASEVRPGQSLFIDDGTLHLTVEGVSGKEIKCRIIVGGELGENKGISVPGVKTSLPVLTPKDIKDVRWALENRMDFIALSFVRNRADIMEARRVLEDLGGTLRIIAKIETRESVDNLDEIIEVVDGMMVARGDLGVEIPLEEVPLAQKRIIDLCRLHGKPVIVATQMLDSMIRNVRATRAEASDVANAVFDGADALMLSGETANGAHPVLAVETMSRIIRRTEEGDFPWGRKIPPLTANSSIPDAVSNAAAIISDQMRAHAVLSLTQSGGTAQMVSKYRPKAPIIGATPLNGTLRYLTMVWGIQPLFVPMEKNLESALSSAVEIAQKESLLSEGDMVVATAGSPVGSPGTTNSIQVITVAKTLLKGLSLLKRDASGVVVRAFSAAEAAEKMTDGAILVTRQTDRDYVPAMRKAAAVICEEGGLTSHAAIVSLELRIPCIVSASGALSALDEGMTVTVDGRRGVVYRGIVRLHSDESG
ncbi:MAG: pyruvate kinase [Thermovirgaceae bacterium]|nr:pyruvate kinase [Thermovirgaceae bacterium]